MPQGEQMKILLATSFALTTVLSSQAFAIGGGGGGLDFKDGLFWGADLNRNEKLDIKEAKAVYNLGDEKVFAKYDTSGEGVITKFEFYDYLNQRNKDE